jgi:KaiC/GvpD/RAD55 family RecA-like ATPase
MKFFKAVKEKSKLRLALIGTSGSGKTYSALAIASGMGKKVAVIDTEKGSASKYADIFDFDVLELSHHCPDTYVNAIKSAEESGYEVIIIDSLSHAWVGKEGALEQVENATKRSKSGNSYLAWGDVTKKHNALIDAMVSSSAHIIATMRSKSQYEMTQDNELLINKTRCSFLKNAVIPFPGKELGERLVNWLNSGVDKKEKEGIVEVEKMTEDQKEELSLLISLSSNPKAVADYIKKRFSVSDYITELSADNAHEVIKSLKAKVNKQVK